MKYNHLDHAAKTVRPVYFVSNRPEAYEYWGEVNREQADHLAKVIVEHASKRFSGIDFRIDNEWHAHDARTATAASYIESHWQTWAKSDKATGGR